MLNRLKEMRQKLGLSRPQMAEFVDMPLNSYIKLERDYMKYNPGFNTIAHVADKLGVSIDYLTGRLTEFATTVDYVDNWHEQFKSVIDLTENGTRTENMDAFFERTTIEKYPYNLLRDIFSYQEMLESSAISSVFFEKLEELLDQLPPRDRHIIRNRYLVRSTLKRIALNYNLSHEGVRQIIADTLFKLKQDLTPFIFDPEGKIEKLTKQAKNLEAECRAKNTKQLVKPRYQILATSLKDTGLSNRTINSFYNVDCPNVIDVVLYIVHKDINRIPNLGYRSQMELFEFLKAKQLISQELDLGEKHIIKKIRESLRKKLQRLENFAVFRSGSETRVESIPEAHILETNYKPVSSQTTDYAPHSLQHKRITKQYSRDTIVYEYTL